MREANSGSEEGPRACRAADLAMERYASGDEPAFAELYAALARRLFGFLRRQVRDVSEAEDLLQQTFLQIHRARASFVPGAEVTTWAFAIARRLVIDRARKVRRRLPHACEENVSQSPVSPLPPADDLVYARELAAVAACELARLPTTQQEVFYLLRGQELSVAETAKALGATQTAVKLRVHRAYVALREALASASAITPPVRPPQGFNGRRVPERLAEGTDRADRDSLASY